MYLIESDIIYLNVLGKPMVILNTLEAVTELLERRSAIYSDRYVLEVLLNACALICFHRPRFVLLRELYGKSMQCKKPS